MLHQRLQVEIAWTPYILQIIKVRNNSFLSNNRPPFCTMNIFLSHPLQAWHFLISTSIEWSTHDPFVLMLMNDCLIPILSDFGAVESIASPWRGKFVIHQPSRLSGPQLQPGKSSFTVWGILSVQNPSPSALRSCEVERMALITAALQWAEKKEKEGKKKTLDLY